MSTPDTLRPDSGDVRTVDAQKAYTVGFAARRRGLPWRETRNEFGARLAEQGVFSERQIGYLLDCFSAGYAFR